jgi:NAD-dependent oxidoreductase involved in siderophore biosynthesis
MNKAEILKLIQQQVPCVSTIETRMRDSLDFHDVHITSLVALVEKAFEKGKNYVLNRQYWDVVPKVQRSMEYGDQYN